MKLSDVARELYRVAPTDFVVARKAKAAELKDAAEADLAGETAKLTKPSASAWAVNLLGTANPELEEEFAGLAAQLRDAQADPDRGTVSRLVAERRALVARAMDLAASGAESASGSKLGQSALEQVERTLLAALADEDALAAVFSGRLFRSLESSGFDPVDLAGAVAGGQPAPVQRDVSRTKSPSKAAAKPAEAKRAQQRQEAVRAAETATEAATAAAEAVDALAEGREELDASKAELATALEELRGRFEQLEAKQAELDAEGSKLAGELSRAKEAKRRADADARSAQLRADRLA